MVTLAKVENTSGGYNLRQFTTSKIRSFFFTSNNLARECYSGYKSWLEVKVALITEGSSRSGESTARLFFKHGAKVLIADVQDDLGQSVSKDIGSSSASFVHCDVTKEKEIEQAVKTAFSQHGKLDIIFNNAGTKHVARVMIPARSGSIISTASFCIVMGRVASHAYTSSKHGVVGLTSNIAVELGRYGIKVNCGSKYVSGHNLVVDGGNSIENTGFSMFGK